MHLHILGICGTFMAGIAQLARELGHRVTGSDAGVYPPMSDFLTGSGITLYAGWDPAHLEPRPDLVIIGNALSRGNPLVEATLNARIPYTSGPAWLAREVLSSRHVLAVSGTHGKTTTTSLLAYFLDATGFAPGFLVGGIPENFGVPARLGGGNLFVIEADEYDTAFFDKRSKFIHYQPSTLVINNVEFDHADIFQDLAAIETQFHHLVRTVPGNGRILFNAEDPNIPRILSRGCWSGCQRFGRGPEADWRISAHSAADWQISIPGQSTTLVMDTPLLGEHNALNAAAAIAAASHVGLSPADAMSVLPGFLSVKRRLENLGTVDGVTVYDDFAHHPTAIAATLRALRRLVGDQRILAVLEPRSNTMRMGVHAGTLADSLATADAVVLHAPPSLGWDAGAAVAVLGSRAVVTHDEESLLKATLDASVPGTRVLIMSNGAFGGLHRKLLAALDARGGATP